MLTGTIIKYVTHRWVTGYLVQQGGVGRKGGGMQKLENLWHLFYEQSLMYVHTCVHACSCQARILGSNQQVVNGHLSPFVRHHGNDIIFQTQRVPPFVRFIPHCYFTFSLGREEGFDFLFPRTFYISFQCFINLHKVLSISTTS